MPPADNRLRRNVEVKATLADLERAKGVALLIGATYIDTLEQSDTFYESTHGRLKLRRTKNEPASLIWYQREKGDSEWLSEYIVVPVQNASDMHSLLSEALGEWRNVRKTRLLYRWHDVRIHLDSVQSLGDFIEFEAEFDNNEAKARELVDRLIKHFEVQPSQRVLQAYVDMLN